MMLRNVMASMAAGAIVLLCGAAAASSENPHVLTLEYGPDRVYPVEVLAGIGTLISFSPDEEVRTVKLSAPDSYRVTVTPDGTGLSVREARPVERVAMSVDTSERHYDFALSAATTTAAPYLVGFQYAPVAAPLEGQSGEAGTADGPVTSYRLSGKRSVRPQSVTDDGKHTYIIWNNDQSLSAVFGEDSSGGEQTADGYMRNGVYTIDRVYNRLIFRVDRAEARAQRITEKVDRNAG